MITPIFRLSQDELYLTVTIRAPYCKLRDAEIAYEGHTFLFHANPYFLRLFLPAEVIDDERGTCDYNTDEGIFTIKVPKKTPFEHFARLEMLSELLRPQQTEPNARKAVEEIEKEEDEGGEEDIECYADQCLPKIDDPSTSSSIIQNDFGYGFGWSRHHILGQFHEEIGDLIDLMDPDGVPICERLNMLCHFDIQRFQASHYLADTFSPELDLLHALAFNPFLATDFGALSEQDLVDLKDLRPRKLPKFEPEVMRQIALSLFDILFGFLYDFRITMGEHNVESGWTISKLSPSLTFLVQWPSASEAVRCTVRHSLVLPLYRNWEFSVQILRDILRILKIGPVAILHCLLCTRRFFNRGGEFRYLFNQLFMDELCLWIQAFPADEELISKLRTDIKAEMAKLKKADIAELDLETVEIEAKIAMLNPLDSDDDEETKDTKKQINVI